VIDKLLLAYLGASDADMENRRDARGSNVSVVQYGRCSHESRKRNLNSFARMNARGPHTRSMRP